MQKLYLLLMFLSFFFVSNLLAGDLYFPPIDSDDWETLNPAELGWDTTNMGDLYNFLEEKGTKAFLILKDGKIVVEWYFDGFGKDSVWYWASAGKTLTATLVGIAQEEGLLKISDRTSKYLGDGWTSCPIEKENLITIRHQLTMTTGLDYEVDDLDCTEPQCLKCKADAGGQWYYHNAPYTLLEQVVVRATGVDYNSYFFRKIYLKTGIRGLWIKNGYNNVFFSTPRSMARFGLLILNKGDWDGNVVICDKNYLFDMLNTSQELNKSYGYLWWLNGKESFMLPGLSRVFNGKLIPNAPDDMVSALGKNGQILNIVPSKGLIVVRMGNRPDENFFVSTQFNNQIWQFLNQIIGETSNIFQLKKNLLDVYPNPARDFIELVDTDTFEISIYNSFGECVLSSKLQNNTAKLRIDIPFLPEGVYYVRRGNRVTVFVKI